MSCRVDWLVKRRCMGEVPGCYLAGVLSEDRVQAPVPAAAGSQKAPGPGMKLARGSPLTARLVPPALRPQIARACCRWGQAAGQGTAGTTLWLRLVDPSPGSRP